MRFWRIPILAASPVPYLLSMSGREEFSVDENWREQKSLYDRCEADADHQFWRQWRYFIADGILLFLPAAGLVGFGRRRNMWR